MSLPDRFWDIPVTKIDAPTRLRFALHGAQRRIPPVLGELCAGIVLGPNLLSLLEPNEVLKLLAVIDEVRDAGDWTSCKPSPIRQVIGTMNRTRRAG